MTIPPDRTDAITPGESLTPGRPITPKGSGFESKMQGSGTPQQSGATSPQGPSPAQGPQGPPGAQGTPSVDSVASQVGTTQDSMGNLQNKLNTKNLHLTNSQKHLLRNKLSNSSTYLRAVNTKLGVETPPMPPHTGGPIEKFLSYVADGENQLDAAKQKLMDIKSKGTDLKPADLMLLQIKMNQAQQEIEYSSTLLGKVISSMTQILNTQL
jgi:hypothetical protein